MPEPLRQRQPRVRDKAYLGWISELPCVACLALEGRVQHGVHVSHIRLSNPNIEGWREVGKAEKPSDFRSAPLCPRHHMDGDKHTAQHKMSEDFFWAKMGISPFALVADLRAAYGAGLSGIAVIAKHAHGGRNAKAASDLTR